MTQTVEAESRRTEELRTEGKEKQFAQFMDWAGEAEMPRQLDHRTVVVVIPAYNEERFIAGVVLNSLQATSHVIVVDDGSTDRTARLAKGAGAEVIRLTENKGKGAALNAGFLRAMDFEPEAVVTLDADTQHDPAEIPILATPILEGRADVVVGSRFIGTESKIPRWRRFGQHTLTAVTNATSGVALTDSQSGYRAFSPLALRQLRFGSRGLALESEMQFHVGASGLKVFEVPISVHYLDGNKRNPIVHGIEVLEAILGLVARRRPLAFLGGPGVILMLGGLMAGFWVLNIVDTEHQIPIGTSVLTALLLISGLLLIVAAVILNTMEHFMGRMHDELKSAVEALTVAHEGTNNTKSPGDDASVVATRQLPERQTRFDIGISN